MPCCQVQTCVLNKVLTCRGNQLNRFAIVTSFLPMFCHLNCNYIHKKYFTFVVIDTFKPFLFYPYACLHAILKCSPDTAVLYHSLSFCSPSVTVSCKPLPTSTDPEVLCIWVFLVFPLIAFIRSFMPDSHVISTTPLRDFPSTVLVWYTPSESMSLIHLTFHFMFESSLSVLSCIRNTY